MIAKDPARPRGRVLLDGAGRTIASFDETERDDRRVADLFRLHVAPEQALPIVLTELAGWRVSAEEPFGRLLVAAGGRPKRHGHTLSRDLARDPAPPDWLDPPVPAGVRLTPVDRPALDLALACLAACPRSASPSRTATRRSGSTRPTGSPRSWTRSRSSSESTRVGLGVHDHALDSLLAIGVLRVAREREHAPGRLAERARAAD